MADPAPALTMAFDDKALRHPNTIVYVLVALPGKSRMPRRTGGTPMLPKRYRYRGQYPIEIIRSRSHIRNTPTRRGGIGAFSDAEIASESTNRVSAGSMIPSFHSRAVL